MKVLHLSTSVAESSAVSRLHNALLANGVDSEICTMACSGKIPKVNIIADGRSKYNILKIVLESKLIGILYPHKTNVLYSYPILGISKRKLKALNEADIIHLHWINQVFLNKRAFKYIFHLGKPVVWTAHDCWPFTGGCHHGCDKYKENCGQCENLGSSKEKDKSFYLLKWKKRFFESNKICMISPSKWNQDNINSSAVFKNSRCEWIPNAIETDVFLPKNKNEARKAWGIRGDETILLFGGIEAVTSPFKGYEYLLKALRIYCQKYECANNLRLVVFGCEAGEMLDEIPTTFVGHIEGKEKMALLYNIADVCIVPSVKECLGYTAMEGMACEIPVLTFHTGGLPDMIEHKKNGYIADYCDSEDLAQGLDWILSHNEGNVLGKAGREKVLSNYSFDVIGKKHKELYKKLLQEKL